MKSEQYEIEIVLQLPNKDKTIVTDVLIDGYGNLLPTHRQYPAHLVAAAMEGAQAIRQHLAKASVE